MIELCLHLPSMDECKNIDTYMEIFTPGYDGAAPDSGGSKMPGVRAVANVRKLFSRVLALLVAGIRPSRLYFGAEFCQRLIPTQDELAAAMDIAAKNALKFTLVTPYVTDDGLRALSKLFAYLEKKGDATEVVVNDLGVLSVLRGDFPRLVPVYGRLMNKMTRMPRFARQLPDRLNPQQLGAYQKCSLLLPHYQKFLSGMGVGRLEFDVVSQGIKMDFGGGPFRASFYYPWTYITSGRVCEAGSVSQPPEKKFSLDSDSRCGRECQKYYVHMFKEDCGCGEKCAHKSAESKYLFQKGNAVFMLCEAPRQVLENLFSRGFDRVIYEPGFPI